MQEIESEAAKALAEELVMSAGLEMPVVDILNQANKNPSLPTGMLLSIWSSKNKIKLDIRRNQIRHQQESNRDEHSIQ